MVFNRRNAENDGNENGFGVRAREFCSKKEVKYFVGGMVAAFTIKKIAETDAAHNLIVNATAGLLNAKDSIEEGIENIKEDAEDIHKEAQEKQKVEIYGPEDIEDEEEDEE